MENDFKYIGGDVPYYQSELLASFGVRHAFFTRCGGVSEGVFSSLNFAVGTGDNIDTESNVFANHRIAAGLFGLTENDICRSYQTHTDNVELASRADGGRGLTKPPYDHGVDGMVTAEPQLLLSVRSADCAPVLLCDKDKTVCAACHSGWRGTVKGISSNAVKIMNGRGAERKNILAAIGPCIGSCCYEVGEDVYREFINKAAEFSSCFTESDNGKYMLDLTSANRTVLLLCGILPENISAAGLCTKCREDEFFSHRRSGPERGTMSSFICL